MKHLRSRFLYSHHFNLMYILCILCIMQLPVTECVIDGWCKTLDKFACVRPCLDCRTVWYYWLLRFYSLRSYRIMFIQS